MVGWSVKAIRSALSLVGYRERHHSYSSCESGVKRSYVSQELSLRSGVILHAVFICAFCICLCILYMPRSRDDVHIVSTEAAQKVLASNSQPALAGDNYL